METGGDFIRPRYHIEVTHATQQGRNKKVKRFRSAFTTDQVNYLEKQFKKSPFIEIAQRKEISEALSIPERSIKIWFQNRRMKEKKEGTIEELDDEQGSRNSQEYLRNNYNNVRTLSANEELRSLPIITNLNQGNGSNKIRVETNTSTNNIKRQMVPDLEDKDSAAKIRAPVIQHTVVTTANSDLVIHPPAEFFKTKHSPPDKTSAEFPIDLCKKSRNEYDAEASHVKQHPFKKKTGNVKKIKEPMSVEFTKQMTPENLSQFRKLNVSEMSPQQTVPDNASSNLRFLVPTSSPFYTQPSISTGGVAWSVMPVVASSSSSVSAPSNPLLNMPSVQDNFAEKPCSCDCHVRQVMPQIQYNFPQQSPSPQYIITAVPFQNPTTKM